jgi:hypothetical protein
MDFEPSGGGRTIGFGSWFGEALPFATTEFNWTSAGKWGAIVGALWSAQAAAGALSGAGVSWAGAHVAHYGPSGILGTYDRYMPNLTLGSSLFYAHAGDVVHLTCDADIRVGQINIYLWRIPGTDNSPTTTLRKSGVEEFDIPIKENGFYSVMNYGTDLWPSPHKTSDDGVRTDLKYKLSWKLQR